MTLFSTNTMDFGGVSEPNPKKWTLSAPRHFSTKPRFVPGQYALHYVRRGDDGEIGYLVVIRGFWWAGSDWTYWAELPEVHPWWAFEETELVQVESDWLEEI